MRFPIRTFGFLSMSALAVSARADMQLGMNTGTTVDWLQSHQTLSVDFRIGQPGAGYNPGGSYTGAFVPIVTGPTGFYSQAKNYPNGQYTIQLNAPNPAAVSVAVGGMFNGLSNVQISGNTYQATFNMSHDGGNILAGAGEIDLNTNGANPVTNFKVLQSGGLANPGGLTPDFAAQFNKFAGGRYMNNAGINNNTSPMTASDLMPSGQNLSNVGPNAYNPGNSYIDQVKWTNANPNAKTMFVNIPFNADPSYIKAVANVVKGVKAGVDIKWEYGNEPWNFAFAHTGWLYGQSQSDNTHSFVNSDTYGRTGEEYGIKSVQMMQAVDSVIPNSKGFLNSQGANQWYVDQAKNAINRNFGNGSVQQYFGSQGISYYPTDNLTSDPHTPQGLYNAVIADIARQHQYLANDIADAHASGLKEYIYETSVNGFLTQSGITAPEMDAWLASPLSGQATTAMLNDMNSQLKQAGEGAMWFTQSGDYWGGQLDPLSAPSQVTLALNSFVATPEPATLSFFGLVSVGLLARRRKTV